jgi:uncharacterized protein YjbI with pentapeptide repeats
MEKDHSRKNLQNASFKNEDLSNVDLSGSDLRGADFSGSNLRNADLTNIRTGIATVNVAWLFLVTLAVSLLSGYFAMLSGRTVQQMLASEDVNIRIAGIVTIVIVILFIAYGWWKGGRNAFLHLLLPAVVLSIIIAITAKVSGYGTGYGMLYLMLSLFLIAVMFVVGTVARAAAGSLSNIIFLIVALSGGMFGRSVGGGIGTVIMAIACMQVSKRALSNVKGFEFLQKLAVSITRKFGTSFRNTKLQDANFSHSKIRNADFTNADISLVNWGDSKKVNCLGDGKIITDKKKKQK